VVFDGLKEASKDITKKNTSTYSEVANRSLNSTLVRSINTTVVALLPVAALLFIGGGILGAGMLNDIALALFVGLTAGAYSSIFIATPIVAEFKEREPAMQALRKRVLAKRKSDAAKAAARVAAGEDPEAIEEPDGADGVDDADDFEDEDDEATPAVVGQRPSSGGTRSGAAARPRPQSGSRAARRNRSSGKRR
jgi:preprotein translocase subunit SecF